MRRGEVANINESYDFFGLGAYLGYSMFSI